MKRERKIDDIKVRLKAQYLSIKVRPFHKSQEILSPNQFIAASIKSFLCS